MVKVIDVRAALPGERRTSGTAVVREKESGVLIGPWTPARRKSTLGKPLTMHVAWETLVKTSVSCWARTPWSAPKPGPIGTTGVRVWPAGVAGDGSKT